MFTREYFREELLRFRGLMSEKSFYDDLSTPSNCKAFRAIYGLFYVYLHSTGLDKDDEIFLQATTLEFDRRLSHMLLR